jgi:hypothetical protein
MSVHEWIIIIMKEVTDELWIRICEDFGIRTLFTRAFGFVPIILDLSGWRGSAPDGYMMDEHWLAITLL